MSESVSSVQSSDDSSTISDRISTDPKPKHLKRTNKLSGSSSVELHDFPEVARIHSLYDLPRRLSYSSAVNDKKSKAEFSRTSKSDKRWLANIKAKTEKAVSTSAKELWVKAVRRISIILALHNWARSAMSTSAQMLLASQRLLDYHTVFRAGDLVFDKTQFKCETSVCLRKSLRKVLRNCPDLRTDLQKKKVVVGLSTLLRGTSLTQTYIQDLARRGCYISVPEKQLVIRSNDMPVEAYFILSGWVFVEEEDGFSQHLTTGDMFGDKDLVSNPNPVRTMTAVTTTEVHMLSLVEEDLRELLSREQDNHKQLLALLRSQWYMKGWPMEVIDQNPKVVKHVHFGGNRVIVKNSDDFNWIVLVVSGSCRVVMAVEEKAVKERQKQIQKMIRGEQNKDMSRTKGKALLGFRPRIQPAIGVVSPSPADTDDPPNSFERMKARRQSFATYFGDVFLKDKKLTACVRLQSLQETSPQVGEQDPDGHEKTPDVHQKNSHASKATVDKQHEHKLPEKQSLTSLPSIYTSSTSTTRPEEEPNKVLITVATLWKGDTYGLDKLPVDRKTWKDKSPQTSLISQGAGVDCLMLDKRLYLRHCGQERMFQVMAQVQPFPDMAALHDTVARQQLWQTEMTRMAKHLGVLGKARYKIV